MKKNLFMDRAQIRVTAGKGGNGASHFRREKFVPLGGPDGGDGGKGGDVVLVAESGMNTLVEFSFRRIFEAVSGDPGLGQRKSGRQGRDEVIRVPIGTLVYTTKGELLFDCSEEGKPVVVAQGGRGGRGNIHFATSLRRAPTLAEKGQPGEERDLVLELKLLADVGVVGLPNAGKSTLLAAVSAARPKIADYPFTTLTPNLGLVRLDMDRHFVMVDIPGLIEGAAQGHGLGHEFLRHIERTRLLVHVLDAGFPGADPWRDFQVLNQELKLFDPKLARKPQVIVLNKLDLIEDPKTLDPLVAKFQTGGYEVFLISAAARQGVKPLVTRLYARLKALPPVLPTLPAVRSHAANEPRFVLESVGPRVWRIRGKEVEKWVAMTDFSNEEAVAKLQNIFDRLGVTEAFKHDGAKEGDTVRVGKEEFTYQEDL